MGESKNSSSREEFNKKPKIEFRGIQVTSDGGLVAVKELDEKMGLTDVSLFNSHGDCIKAKLCPGNVHSADGCREFFERV